MPSPQILQRIILILVVVAAVVQIARLALG